MFCSIHISMTSQLVYQFSISFFALSRIDAWIILTLVNCYTFDFCAFMKQTRIQSYKFLNMATLENIVLLPSGP